ncbi:MAG: SpoVG family protein [Candidatus Omnitrophica bacterium]|nr:SpoVG family protein [Candidatus Omnitrophota bacterium]
MAELKVMRLYRFDTDSKIKAFVDIAIGDFVVRGLRLLQGKKGLFLAMPQQKAKNGRWYNLFYPLSKLARQNLTEIILTAYQE